MADIENPTMDDVTSSAGEIVGSYVSLHTSSTNYRMITSGLAALKEKAIRRQCAIAPAINAFSEQSTTTEAHIDTSLEVLNLIIKASSSLPNFAHRCFATGGSFGVLGLICIWVFATAPLAIFCWIISGVAWAIGGIAAVMTPLEDPAKNIFHLLYDMDSSAVLRWQATNESLSGLAGAEKLWHVTSQTSTDDWRRNGGSSELEDRVAATLVHQSPLFVQTNVTPFCLQVQAKQLNFLPDCVWVFTEVDTNDKSTGSYQVYTYSEIALEYNSLTFQESGDVPTDTQVTGHTWQYVNKDGSPDRRFRDNYQLSICEYGSITLHLGSDLTLLLYVSSAPIAKQFVEALQKAAKQAKLPPSKSVSYATLPAADGTGELASTRTDTARLNISNRSGSDLPRLAPKQTRCLLTTNELSQDAIDGNIVKVKAILDAGVSPNALNDKGKAPLTDATEFGRDAIVKLLLDYNADCNIKQADGSTPLLTACIARNTVAVELMLNKGADVNVQANGSTPLGVCLYNQDFANAKKMLANGANPNTPGFNGYLPLEICVSQQNWQMVNVLLLAAADAKSVGVTGYSVLEVALAVGNAAIFEALLEHGADGGLINLHGNTPLMDAAIAGQVEIVKILLQHGVSIATKNAKGQTALDQAIAMGNSNIVQLLQNGMGLSGNSTSVKPLTDASSETPCDAEKATSKEPDESYAHLLQELQELIGLDSIKTDVEQLVTFLQVQAQRRERGLKVPEESLHMVFTGNPGTGKTTVARLVAKLYKSMGVLSSGQMIEADRSDLVAGYLGQTAIKVQEVVKTALGGVLFIDEAYSLTEGDSGGDEFGHEAVDTLLKLMEDQRGNLVVITAGYTEPMQKFIQSNPGLQSRFNKFLHFEDYTPDQLTAIFQQFARKNDYTLDTQAVAECKLLFQKLYANRDKTFGNARLARNLFEKTINCQAVRVMQIKDPSKEALCNLNAEDIPAL